jgi:hypothetical protein
MNKDNEYTLEDIRNAMDLIKEEKKEEVIYEDDFQKIWSTCDVCNKIKLKQPAMKILDDMFTLGDRIKKDQKKGKIATFCGIPVVVSDDIEEGTIELRTEKEKVIFRKRCTRVMHVV